MSIDPADEGRHPAGADPWWQEGWEFDAAWGSGTSGALVRCVLRPATRQVWYVAALARPGRPVVSVVDLDVALPTRTAFELRAPGLWAEQICEEPLAHWSVNNEAHGVALDDPDDAFGRGYGEVVPIAFELGWEDVDVPRPLDGPSLGVAGLDGYEVATEVHGDVHVGTEVLAVAATGRRRHWWGVRPWATATWGYDRPIDPAAARVGVPLTAGPATATARLEWVLEAGGWRERCRPG